MNICVVGTGYVGLVTGAVFADLGNEVVCVDNEPTKIAALEDGEMPIYEPGLEEMVARNVADGRLGFTTDLTAAVRRSLIVFITVGTPARADGQTDLSAVEEVARGIGQAMERHTVVVNKSTVPVGTGDFVREVIERSQPRPVPFDIVSNHRLVELGARVRAYDPVAMPNARTVLPPAVVYCDSPYEAARGADGLALVTEWNEFKFLNLERVRALMRRPVIFDGRNLWAPERMRRLGFEYYSVGRRPVPSG